MVTSAVDGTEITVRSGGSGEPGLNFVAAAFQKATGHAVKITYDDQLLRDDEVFDVVVASSDVLERELRRAGSVEEGGIIIGRNLGLGVAVRSGAPLPKISGMEGFKRAVLEAETFPVTTHTSGFYVESMLKRMGIYEQMEAKIERFPNGPSLMKRLLNGKGKELAILSINQIRRYEDKGLVLVGPIPEEMQYYIEFVAVPMTASANKDVAWEFARFCAGPGKPLLIANGFN